MLPYVFTFQVFHVALHTQQRRGRTAKRAIIHTYHLQVSEFTTGHEGPVGFYMAVGIHATQG